MSAAWCAFGACTGCAAKGRGGRGAGSRCGGWLALFRSRWSALFCCCGFRRCAASGRTAGVARMSMCVTGAPVRCACGHTESDAERMSAPRFARARVRAHGEWEV
eukprot:6552671-Prymnesium_polylepis.1